MKELNKGGEGTNPDIFNINPVTISNWLGEQKSSIYKSEIAAIEHALNLIQNISEELKKKPYVGLSGVFDEELTPTEFTEYQRLGGLEARDNTEGKSMAELKRIFFLEKIYGKELNRAGAETYAELKILERSNAISPEQESMLKDIEDGIREDEKKSSQDFKNTFKKILESKGVDLGTFQVKSQIEHRAKEIMDSTLGRIQKK